MLKKTYFKISEAQNLAAERDGTFTVLEKLVTRVYFRMQNDSTKQMKFVHHNWLYPTSRGLISSKMKQTHPHCFLAGETYLNTMCHSLSSEGGRYSTRPHSLSKSQYDNQFCVLCDPD